MSHLSLTARVKGHYLPLMLLFFFASSASFAVWAGAFFLDISPRIEHIITWAFIVFGVYGINRYTDVEDCLNDSSKRVFFYKEKKYLYISVTLLLASGLWLLCAGSLTVYHILCIYGGIAYSVPLFPWLTKKLSIKWVRLKEITFVKSMLVSLIIGSSFFALYFPRKNIDIGNLEIVTLMIGASLSLFVNTIFCDVRDIVGDKCAGVRTIPVILNARRTLIYFIAAPSALWFVILTALFASSRISSATFVFLTVIIAYPALYIGLYYSKLIPQKLTFFIADSCVPLFAMGLVVLKFFVT